VAFALLFVAAFFVLRRRFRRSRLTFAADGIDGGDEQPARDMPPPEYELVFPPGSEEARLEAEARAAPRPPPPRSFWARKGAREGMPARARPTAVSSHPSEQQGEPEMASALPLRGIGWKGVQPSRPLKNPEASSTEKISRRAP
jgi:hypothetical protein